MTHQTLGRPGAGPAKNILFVGSAYYPNVDHGGPIRVMRSYALGLTALGHNVTIYCSNFVDRDFNKMAGETVEGEREGVRVVYLNVDLRLSYGLTISLDLLRYLRREISTFQMVHLFGVRSFYVDVTALFARRHGVPYIIHPMGTMSYNNARVVPKYLWDQVFGASRLRGAKYIVEPSDEQVAKLLDMGFSDEKVVAVPWSPDPDLARHEVEYGHFRRRLGIPSSHYVVLFLGRIHSKKRLDLLIGAIAHMDRQDTHLVVVGHDDDGSLSDLKSLVEQLGVESLVHWAGPVHSPESAQAYVDADVFALISEYESVPMALLEACSMGVPVVISDNTGMSNLVHDKAGLVVDMDVEAVARGLSSLIDSGDLQEKYAQGGRKLIEKEFSAHAVGTKLVSLYD